MEEVVLRVIPDSPLGVKYARVRGVEGHCHADALPTRVEEGPDRHKHHEHRGQEGEHQTREILTCHYGVHCKENGLGEGLAKCFEQNVLIHATHRTTRLVIGVPEWGLQNANKLEQRWRNSEAEASEYTEVRRGVLFAHEESELFL